MTALAQHKPNDNPNDVRIGAADRLGLAHRRRRRPPHPGDARDTAKLLDRLKPNAVIMIDSK